MTSIFNKKIYLSDTNLLQGFTDIHSHILPGVDDGISSFNEAWKALTFLKSVGFDRICLTPHIMDELPENNTIKLRIGFNEFSANCSVDIQLRLAAEYMIDSGFQTHFKNGLLAMKSRHVLVENSCIAPFSNFNTLLSRMVTEKYIPIIAHPERYLYMSDNDYSALKFKNYKFQLNLLSLSGYYGSQVQHRAEFLLKNDLYDFIGTDFHNLDIFKKRIAKIVLTQELIGQLKKLIQNNMLLW